MRERRCPLTTDNLQLLGILRTLPLTIEDHSQREIAKQKQSRSRLIDRDKSIVKANGVGKRNMATNEADEFGAKLGAVVLVGTE